MNKKMFLVIPLLIGALFLGGCTTTEEKSTYANEMTKLDTNQVDLIKNTPIPTLTDSLERQNIAKRAEIFNKANKISYIYLINYGKIMSYFTVKGKVSSLRSYMVPQEKLVYGDGTACTSYSSGYCYSVSAPDIDGSYGENVDGIFFFTTDGAYVEWKGDYMMSDQPLVLTDKPALVRDIK